MTVKKSAIIVTGVGLVIGVAEALLYYNLGQSSGDKFSYKIPPKKEFFKTVGLVLVSSVLTAALSSALQAMMPDQELTKKNDSTKTT